MASRKCIQMESYSTKDRKKPKIKKGKIIIFKEDNRVKTSNSLDRITNHIHRIG